jgi:predicted metal-dependent hydrolase
VMLLPEHLREFILLHELCHTRHHNHSVAFHLLLDSLVDGNEKRLNTELRKHRIPKISE